MKNAMKKWLALLLTVLMVAAAMPFAALTEGELIEETLTPVEPETPAEPVVFENVSNTVVGLQMLASGEEAAEPTYLEQIAALQAEAEALEPASETLQADCADIYTRLMAVYEPAAAEYQAGTMTEEDYNAIYNAVGTVVGILNGYGYDPYAVEQPAANDSIWDQYGRKQVIVALRTDGTIPGEPAVQGETGYIYFNSSYSGQKDQYQTFANSATGIVDSSIVNHEHFDTDTPNTSMGLALSSGTNPATMVSAVNFETALLNAAKANYASSVIINGTNGITLAQAYANYSDNITQYYEIFPYVVKIEKNYGYWMWHIDCAIRPKANVTLTYNINIPSGMTFPSNITIPNSESAPPPADFNIGSIGGLTNGKMTVEDSSGGEYEFTFLGWSTKRDDTGTMYQPGDTITINEDTILYAIWNSNPAIGTGNLRIEKKVVAEGSEVIDTEQSFAFNVTIKNADGTDATGTYSYTIYNASTGVAVSDGTDTVGNGGMLNLKHNQYAVIRDLPAVNSDSSEFKNVTVTETQVEGYTATWDNGGESASVKIQGGRTSDVTCTNTKEKQTTTVTATKRWDDNSNANGIRPDSVELTLFVDGEAVADVEPVVTKADNTWTYTWDGVPANAVYTVDEANVPVGYEKTVDGMTVTNTLATTNVSVAKAWSDYDNAYNTRPESITVNLTANGAVVANQMATISADGNWCHTWQSLPTHALVTAADGSPSVQAIVYGVVETAVPGYTTAVTGSATEGFTVTNTLNTHTLTVKKTVSGNMGDQSKEFAFTTTIAGVANNESLHHDETVAYTVPYGAQVGVTENQDGYTYSLVSATYKDAENQDVQLGKTDVTNGISFTMPDGDVTVVINNDKTATVDTGILLDSLPYVLILGVVGAALVLWFIRKRRVDD